MPRKYPMEALRTVREHAREVRVTALAARLGDVRRAEQALVAAKLRRQEDATHTRAVLQTEQERLSGGQARAADLQQELSYRLGAALRQGDLAARERQAGEQLAASEREARAEAERLARAEADREAVRRHQRRFEDAEQRRADEAADEAAHDLTAAKGARKP